MITINDKEFMDGDYPQIHFAVRPLAYRSAPATVVTIHAGVKRILAPRHVRKSGLSTVATNKTCTQQSSVPSATSIFEGHT